MPPKKKEEEPAFPNEEYVGGILNTFSCDFTRLWNTHLIDDNTILTACGNLVQIIDLTTKKVEWVLGIDGGGIGAICVHPSKEYFAVAEKVGSQSPAGTKPKVYVYSYAGRNVVKTLKAGTENYYTTANYNSKGDKLATVGGEDDYMLTVWNWEQETVILRFKAWGSEVFRVTFNPYDDGFLTTSGNGHIKFWEMAQTFTGLKLQGAIGKFGKVDIQDIVGYAELPDGKVLSGSQDGTLLMWEANLLKIDIRLLGGAPCHDGPVEAVELLEETNAAGETTRAFMTAGNDGYMKYWRFSDIDMADSSEDMEGCQIQCIKSIKVGDNCCIRSVAKGTENWIIQDSNGAYWRTPILNMSTIYSEIPIASTSDKLLQMHAGAITCIEASPTDYCCVTGGRDGTMRMWSFVKKQELYHRAFSAGLACLHWVPLSVDKTGSLIVAAFENGVVRILKKTSVGFSLVSAWKPHTTAICDMAFNSDHTWMATVSTDGKVFFFEIKDITSKWVPVGESSLPSTANCVYWEGTKLIAGLENGEVFAVLRPDPDSIDPNITFVFECTYEKLEYLQRPKPPEKAVKQRNIEDDPDEDEDEEEEEETMEVVHTSMDPLAVNSILRLPVKQGNNLVIAMQHIESAYTYTGVSWPHEGIEVTPEDPLMNVSHLNTVVRRMKLSPMGTYLMMGCNSGTVILRDVLGKNTSPLKKVWHLNLAHDGRSEIRQSGACLPGMIHGMAMSFDESILLTVGEDGSFLSHQLKGIPDAAEPPPSATVDVNGWAQPTKEIPDISSYDALSIQQTKDKEDKDRAHEAAQLKKLTLNEKVKNLQLEYQAIVNSNANALPGRKINNDELELDPEITQLLHKENERLINEVSNKWAWESAKSAIARKKLEVTYVSCLKVDRIVLNAFASEKCVSSFRTPELTSEQKRKIQLVHDLILNENQRRNQMHQDPGTSPDLASPVSEQQEPNVQPEPVPGSALSAPTVDVPDTSEPAVSADTGEVLALNSTKKSKKEEKTHVKSQLEKAEERKRQRTERKALYDELLSKRPLADQEDPKDEQAIKKAESGMGDKKLKTDPNYIVKETERVTAERKERQLILLEESINTLRLDFNERFLAMRDLKERLIVNINRDMKKIDEINKKLKVDEKTDLYKMEDFEMPDKMRQNPCSRDALQQYEKERAKARRKAEKDAKAKAGFGGDLGGDDNDEEDETDETDKTVQARKASLRTHTRRESHTITAEMRLNLELKTKLEKLPKSALEQEEESIKRYQLIFEKDKLRRKINKTIATFDEALEELRREKFKLEGDLKMADMRILLLYRELVLLKEFKKRDEALTKKLEGHRNEKLEVTQKTNQCQVRLNEKMKEIELLLEREKTYMNDMLQLLSGLPQGMRDQLMKIFRKKVKRKTLKGEGEEEEEESSDDDWESDEEEENNDDEEDVCPEGCDESTYEEVLQMREKRLDQEEVVTDFQKSIEQLRKENDALTKREEATNTKLGQVENEIQSFQTEKQQKLNQLETSIVLKLSQIQALNESQQVPSDHENLVVFTNGGMRDLCNRIVQLQTDKKVLNKEHNELKRTHCQLMKEKRATEAYVKEWEQKVYEVQLLKFGQKVDLESLEDVSVDRQTEELKERLRKEEITWEKAIRVQVQALKKLKEQQQQTISKNSQLLKQLADLRQEQQRLEEQLNVSQNKILTRMAGGSRIATSTDRSNLKDLVVMQQREIDALKSEIAMLRRKGGHVYTPVVSKVVKADGTTD
eukprot:TRINITY_DN17214_c0_g1_i1.p1 TRINITY_DN17214_c0_g1~~TRINITY_DN17214_c0_g1_i1.p1  ORF type:complete len:1743 (+),score=505.59 TRINITY_DN17214_c0_g1_i1:121-5349(+)